MRRIFQRIQKYTTATQNGSDSSSVVFRRFISPATVLAFLIAIILSVLVVRSSQSLQNQSPDYTTETVVDSQTSATEQIPVEDSDTGSESTQGESTTSVHSETNITTRAVIQDGVGSVHMQVNGDEVPVEPNGSTHHVIENDSGRTTLDIDVHNNQSSSSNADEKNSTDTSIRFRSQSEIDIDH